MSYSYDLSVVLPVYNVEKYLPSCLESLLKQSFKGSMQIILVEDQSTDNSLSICQQYAEKYEQIQLIAHEKNGGSAVARNTGLDEVLGEYFVFVDPDDLLPETAFEVLYQHINKSGADIVKGSNTSFTENRAPSIAAYNVSCIEDYHESDCLTVLLKHEKLRGHPWGKIYRCATFNKTRFTAGYRMAQDLLYNAEIFSNASHVQLIPDVVYQYRIHSGGATGKKYETGAYLSWLKCIDQIENFITTPFQKSAYQELKIRTLTQISREARGLRDDSLGVVFEQINLTRTRWLPSFKVLVFKDKLSLRSVIRYFKFTQAMKKLVKLQSL